MKRLILFLLLLVFGVFLISECKAKKKKHSFANFVRMPAIFKGFTWDKLLKLKKKLGENKWIRLKHLFLLNPHLPVLVLAGQDVTQDDIVNVPNWMQQNTDAVQENEEESVTTEVKVLENQLSYPNLLKFNTNFVKHYGARFFSLS